LSLAGLAESNWKWSSHQEDQRRATVAKRFDNREILGAKTMRGITLK
jgi:hypothetical protein